MTNEKQKKRAKVTGVTVNVVYPNGNPGTFTIDPKVTKALFWDDETVSEILGSYYESKKPKSEMTKKQLIDLFGTIGKKVAKNKKDKFKVDKKVIEEIWNEEDDNGYSVAMMGKTFICIPSPGGDG
jgi:hypothetical protein